jgi:hypothetical protein
VRIAIDDFRGYSSFAQIKRFPALPDRHAERRPLLQFAQLLRGHATLPRAH